jgi:hypothetical protein
MKYFTIFVAFLLISCVKDSYEMSKNQLFELTVNGESQESLAFEADNYSRYKIDLTAFNDVLIDNGQQATIAVSDGFVAAGNNMGSFSSNQITIEIIGGRLTFYYFAGRLATDSAIMTVTIAGLTQAFEFHIDPSEPDDIALSVSNNNPSTTDNVQITAYLLKNNSTQYVSDNLRVNFSAVVTDNTNGIVPYLSAPFYANSQLVQQNGFVTAGIGLDTNDQPGSIQVTASYKGVSKNLTLTFSE